MLITTDDRFMSLQIDDRVVATATERAGGLVGKSPAGHDRSQTITALAVLVGCAPLGRVGICCSGVTVNKIG